jgi:hypothetical protein
MISAERDDLGRRNFGFGAGGASRAERRADARAVEADSRIPLELMLDLRPVCYAETRSRPWLE